ncbi:adenosylcobinamide-GDP ribazoletransferase [Archaeoglobus neptunius]|uniref:adenosylcobinamide-GDP ribazoletransferase n=1 Tax=Archaeoglobus neptunius TaxID=2798580 RepID=UPI001926F04A|nr:adenosylcobinamide-GDP ribazoletransferase [Archaeoglobus neptunius]
MLGDALSFLTTIPVRGDVEVLRRNLWMFPYAAIVIGLVTAIPAIVYRYAGLDIRFLAVAFYVAIEGINHIDGLADFGDALFAPESRKMGALKDLNTGTGGVVTLAIYFILLFHILARAEFVEIVFSQVVAKYSMILIMFASKPSWEGMASYMMEFTSLRDVAAGAIPLIALSYFTGIKSVYALFFAFVAVFLLKRYSEAKFGGINGDVIGAANCITFVLSLITLEF